MHKTRSSLITPLRNDATKEVGLVKSVDKEVDALIFQYVPIPACAARAVCRLTATHGRLHKVFDETPPLLFEPTHP